MFMLLNSNECKIDTHTFRFWKILLFDYCCINIGFKCFFFTCEKENCMIDLHMYLLTGYIFYVYVLFFLWMDLKKILNFKNHSYIRHIYQINYRLSRDYRLLNVKYFFYIVKCNFFLLHEWRHDRKHLENYFNLTQSLS